MFQIRCKSITRAFQDGQDHQKALNSCASNTNVEPNDCTCFMDDVALIGGISKCFLDTP